MTGNTQLQVKILFECTAASTCGISRMFVGFKRDDMNQTDEIVSQSLPHLHIMGLETAAYVFLSCKPILLWKGFKNVS